MVWRRISIGLTVSNSLLYEVYDQIFTRSYNAACTAQGISVDRMPLWGLLLATILMLVPSLAARRNGALVFCAVLSILMMFMSLCAISSQLSSGFDPWGDCFTFQGDNEDQTATEAAYAVMYLLYLLLTFPVCLVDVAWVWGMPLVRRWRAGAGAS